MSKFKPLPRSFYEPTADVVAPKLLGHWLIRNTPQGPCGGPIVETEAYVSDDPACHAFGGKTARNQEMWGEPGRSYVYLIYGYHWCFNAVCQPIGIAEAVLVRAVEPMWGEDFMHKQRPVADQKHLTNGPAKLCKAMDIDRALDGADLCDNKSPLFIAENPQLKSFLAERGPLVTTTRIGITRAAERPLRFYLDGSSFVSRRVPRAKAGRG
ncbi:MAG: putative 3-methyladenine glycosylase [Pedosphaera sp.]|nr:putative 3-methyladenine glycosylase [Pedosphaera sp.]